VIAARLPGLDVPTDSFFVDGLEVRVALFRQPYDEGIISPEQLYAMIVEAAREAASRIARRKQSGRYTKDSLATLIMDPSVPVGALNQLKHVMAAVLIGPDADRLLKNAWAKIVKHAETGQDCGISVFTEPHRMGAGYFNWGLTAMVNGTLGGASGLNQFQDRAEAITIIADVNEAICTAIAAWEAEFVAATGGRPAWHTFDGNFADDSEFGEITTLEPIIGTYVLAA
jgi:hypothetical protein